MLKEADGGIIWHWFVVPVADDDVLRNEVDGAVRAGFAGFPCAVAGDIAVEEAVAPDEHFNFSFGYKMFVVVVNGFCEKLAGVFAFAAGAFFIADEEDFVHTDVKGVGIEGVDKLVHEVEDDFVDLGVGRAPFTAVDVGVVLRDVRGLVKLWVFFEQGEGVFCPGLMAETVEQGDEADAVFAGQFGKLSGVVGSEALFAGQLGMRGELEGVIDLQDKDVDLHRCEDFGD